MIIYALVGKSGTGKSYKAQYVAGMYGVEYILDDGLLIKGAKILAGVSAKREDTRIAAVRRAVFLDYEHRQQVIEAIKVCAPEKLLIIGTSENMIKQIMKALEIGNEYILIGIEDVSKDEEIEAAGRARRTMGKHVIPVPTFELKRDFSGYFLDSIRQFVRKSEDEIEYFEKTIVRPTFSYLGKYEIKDGALKAIVNTAALKVENVHKIVNIDVKGTKAGIILTAGVILRLKEPLYAIGDRMAQSIKNEVEYMTGINIVEVNISVKGIKID